MIILAKLGAVEMKPAFKPYLTDRLSYLQTDSATALAFLGDSEGRDEVKKSLLVSRQYFDPRALEALCVMKDGDGVRILDAMKKSGSDRSDRVGAIADADYQFQTLGKTPDQKVKFLEAALTAAPDPRKQPLGWILKRLGELGTPEALQLLENEVVSSDFFPFQQEAFLQLMRHGKVLGHLKVAENKYRFSVQAPGPTPTDSGAVAAQPSPSVAAETSKNDVSSLSDKQLVEAFDVIPATDLSNRRKYDAKDEILLRGASPEMISGLVALCEKGLNQPTRDALETMEDLRAKVSGYSAKQP
jgi:hypothetical protein